jgi:murein L,D-transpeptidase YafK
MFPVRFFSLFTRFLFFLVFLFSFFLSAYCSENNDKNLLPVPIPLSIESITASYRAGPALEKRLKKINCHLGSPIFIRILKKEAELELWIKKGAQYTLFKTYSICDYSGEIGPKLKEGDKQSPEGFYKVTPEMMNPWSNYHLAFNIGFPNEYDRGYERTGSNIMVHGRCSSVGCFAMTDFRMDEIYTLADAALRNGQKEFSVHIFPFRLSKRNMQAHAANSWYSFWLNLKEGYDLFESDRIPPLVEVYNNRYYFSGAESRAAHSQQSISGHF